MHMDYIFDMVFRLNAYPENVVLPRGVEGTLLLSRVSNNNAVRPCFPFKSANLFVYSLHPADHTRRPPSAVMEQLGTLNATLRRQRVEKRIKCSTRVVATT